MKLLLSLLASVLTVGAADSPDRGDLLRKMDERAAHFGDLSRRVWELAEVGYKEVKSSELLRAELRGAGFAVTENVAGIPTAFTASWGQGKPVIGILGEFDALPGLSQEDYRDRK